MARDGAGRRRGAMWTSQHLAVVHLVDVVARRGRSRSAGSPARWSRGSGRRRRRCPGTSSLPPASAGATRPRTRRAPVLTMLQPMRTWRFEALGLVLGGDEDLAQPGVHAVRQGEVDDAIGPAEADGRLGPVLGRAGTGALPPLRRGGPRPRREADRMFMEAALPRALSAHRGPPFHAEGGPVAQSRLRRSTRAGAPSAPTRRRGRQTRSYSPGSASERSRPSTMTDSGLEQGVVRGELGAARLLEGEVVETHELDPGPDQVGGRVLGEVDVVGLELLPEHLARHARLEEHAQVVAQVEGPRGRRDPRGHGRPARPREPCPGGSRGGARPPWPRRPGNDRARRRGSPSGYPGRAGRGCRGVPGRSGG